MMHVTPRMKKNSAANLYVLCVMVWDKCRTIEVSDGDEPPPTLQLTLS
jgi:hypothetical protein